MRSSRKKEEGPCSRETAGARYQSRLQFLLGVVVGFDMDIMIS